MTNPLHINGVAFGTFPFSNVFGKVSGTEADKIVRKYLENSGGYLQTAPYYYGVDVLMKKILKNIPRDSYCLGTLCVKDRESKISGSYASIISQCDDSLAKLGLDYIDLYLTSTPVGSGVPLSETIGAMDDLKQQGKIRAIGVCNVNLAELKAYNKNGNVKYVQNRLSLLDKEADKDVRAYCAKNDISLIPYNVIEWGLLTEKSLESWDLPKSDLRVQVLPVFMSIPKRKISKWVTNYLQPIAAENNVTIEALAIHWVLSQQGVEAALVGATTVSQITNSLQANTLFGRDDIVGKLDIAVKAFEHEIRKEYGMGINDFLRNSFGKW